jgi:hypothetical protein
MDFTSGASGGMNFYTNNTTSTPRMTITSAGTVSIAGLLDVGSGSLEIPNGASPTVDATGELALNTTLNSLSYATSTTGGELPLYPPFRFTIASSSWTGTSTEIGYPTTPNFEELVTTGICYANGSGRIIVGNGISTTTPVTLSVGTTTVAVNRRFNKNGTMIRYHVGTPTTLSQVQCSFERVYLR